MRCYRCKGVAQMQISGWTGREAGDKHESM
jgi:hypothetical protein